MSKPVVIGGKLKLKGSSGTSSAGKKRRKRDREEELPAAVATGAKKSSKGEEHAGEKEGIVTGSLAAQPEMFMTESQRKYMKRKEEIEARNAKKIVGQSYRERIEGYNHKLSQMSEHNDIPRVSAAGNG
jgi:protein FAM32A